MQKFHIIQTLICSRIYSICLWYWPQLRTILHETWAVWYHLSPHKQYSLVPEAKIQQMHKHKMVRASLQMKWQPLPLSTLTKYQVQEGGGGVRKCTSHKSSYTIPYYTFLVHLLRSNLIYLLLILLWSDIH